MRLRLARLVPQSDLREISSSSVINLIDKERFIVRELQGCPDLNLLTRK
jgi:hypothetical protein